MLASLVATETGDTGNRIRELSLALSESRMREEKLTEQINGNVIFINKFIIIVVVVIIVVVIIIVIIIVVIIAVIIIVVIVIIIVITVVIIVGVVIVVVVIIVVVVVIIIIESTDSKHHRELENIISTLENTIGKLKQENSRVKQRADMSEQQLEFIHNKKEEKEREMEILQQQNIELSTTSDHKAAIGQLQQQILALKVLHMYMYMY